MLSGTPAAFEKINKKGIKGSLFLNWFTPLTQTKSNNSSVSKQKVKMKFAHWSNLYVVNETKRRIAQINIHVAEQIKYV